MTKNPRKSEMNKFYFITYEYQIDGIGTWYRSNATMGIHPTVWLKDLIENSKDRYHILFYSEISEEDFNLIKGWIN
jgi:hypothetical protein